MSIYAKPISQIEAADLQELLDNGDVENIRLEFKREPPEKDEMLKKLSSFANTYGGFMVVGASAKSSDGRISAIEGVDAQPGYKQKVVDWCFAGASPPLTVEVSDPIAVPSASGKVCYVISVTESDIAPHFLNGRKGVWVRTDEFSARFEARLADENELRHLLDRRRLVLERRTRLLNRAKRRFEVYAKRKDSERSDGGSSLGTVIEFSVVPRFPAHQLCEQEALGAAIRKSCTDWRRVFFPRPESPTISQQESAIVSDAARGTSIFEVNVWGMLFYAADLMDKQVDTSSIHLHEFVGYILLFIRHASTMLRLLGYSGPILVDANLSSLMGVSWAHGTQFSWGASGPGSPLDDEAALSIQTTAAELQERRDKIAADIIRYVLFSVNLANLVDAQPKVEALIRAGHEFNFWGTPSKLLL